MDTLFFILSKLGWALIRPETLIVILLLVGLVFIWIGRSRTGNATLSSTFLLLILVAIFPLGDLLLRPLERQFAIEPLVQSVERIIVLGGAENPQLTKAWKQPQLNAAGERYLAGITLANRFPRAELVFSGGSGALIPGQIREASIAEKIFLDAGITPSRIKVESASRNTAENASNTLALFQDVPKGTTLLVTSAHHMPRAMATFCSAGWTNLTAWPVDLRSGAFWQRVGWNLARNLNALNRGVKEWVGFLAYRWTGRISAKFMKGCPPVTLK